MVLDILLACAGAVVAIYGIARDLKPTSKVILIGLAVFVAAATIAKAYADARENDLIKEALTGTLNPTPPTITEMYKLMKEQALKKGYSSVDYVRVADGMVFYLEKSNAPREIVVLERLEIAHLCALLLMDEGSTGIEKALQRNIPILGYRRSEEALISQFLGQTFQKQDFDDSGYSEDLYWRLGILAASSVRQVLQREPSDWNYDGEKGVTVTFEIDGQTKTLNIPDRSDVDRFSAEGANARVIFAELDDKLREAIDKSRPKTH